MISNRRGSRRSAAPVERLREFSINTSKGIDVSQSPVNSNTVAYAKNLITNPDGSLSLRKPLKFVKTTATRTHTLFDGAVVTYGVNTLSKGFLRITRSGEQCPIEVRVYNYNREESTFKYRADGDGVTDLINKDSVQNLSFINLNTATLVTNAIVNFNYQSSSKKFIASELYDANTKLPRYLRIERKPGDANNTYTITVLEPEPNELTLADDGPILNPNLVLDNPYDTRDTQTVGYPVFKSILGFARANVNYDTAIPINGTTVSETTSSVARVAASNSLTWNKDKPINGTELKTVAIFPNGIKVSVNTNLALRSTSGGYVYVYAPRFEDGVFEGITAEFAKNSNDSDNVSVSIKVETVAGKAVLDETYTSFQDGFVKETLNSDSTATDLIVTVSVTATVKMTVTQTLQEGNYPEYLRAVHSGNTGVRYCPLVGWASGAVALKVFGAVSTELPRPVYATWLASDDGVTWKPVLHPTPNADGVPSEQGVYVIASDPRFPTVWYPKWEWTAASDKKPSNFSMGKYYPGRPDTIFISPTSRIYMFRAVTVAPDNPSSTVPVAEAEILAELKYTLNKTQHTEVAYTEFPNAVYGKKLYHKKRIFSYGHEKFFNNIFVSDIDNFNTPLYNVIDIDAKTSDTVTALVPWRDYLVSATPNAVYLHTAQDDGYLTKTVTTSLGIPKEDARCCVPILNGILVKSGLKLYLVYPNAYAGTDDVLNLTPISQPVDEYLEEFEGGACTCKERFAFSTESEYVLMLASEDKTLCIRYNYTTRTWNMCEYPVRIVDYDVRSIEDILLYSRGVSDEGPFTEYKFDADLDTYADQISATESVPIEFEWDSGQKTDNISTRKQFTESKIVFATQDEDENFPMELIVAVDGDPNITRVDVRSDAPTLKADTSVGRLNTQLRMDENVEIPGRSSNGLIRQLVVRYSGRGRSVRHVLRGVARSPFKMYETYVRYKLIDNKR